MEFKYKGRESAYKKEWYEKNKERHKANATKNKRRYTLENRQKIFEIKSNPCTDCGLCYDPVCMDFDHVSGKKITEVSMMVSSQHWKSIKAEIDKCELVCSNCHRLRTKNRKLNKA